MKNYSIHIVGRSGGEWSVRKTGESRAVRSFSSQSKAVAFARTTAKCCHGGEIIIHGRNGQIREREVYVRESHCPKGRR